MKAFRDAKGRWPKGVSGNLAGRSPVVQHIMMLARTHTESAVNTLATICADEREPSPARVAAAVALFDRGWGKPPQAIEVSDPDRAELAQAMASVLRSGLVRTRRAITYDSGVSDE